MCSYRFPIVLVGAPDEPRNEAFVLCLLWVFWWKLSRNAQAAAQLQRHTQEEGLRQLRSIAEQEAAASEDDRLELQRTRRDLDTLVRAATGPPAGRGEVAENAPHLTLDEKEGGAGESAQEEVQRLIAERAGLLQTGVYKAGDPVIAALDSKLQTLSAA